MREVAEAIKNADSVIALTGAGISTESGIPDFRSKGGLWSRYEIEEYGYIHNLLENPGRVWKMFADMIFILFYTIFLPLNNLRSQK